MHSSTSKEKTEDPFLIFIVLLIIVQMRLMDINWGIIKSNFLSSGDNYHFLFLCNHFSFSNFLGLLETRVYIII